MSSVCVDVFVCIYIYKHILFCSASFCKHINRMFLTLLLFFISITRTFKPASDYCVWKDACR